MKRQHRIYDEWLATTFGEVSRKALRMREHFMSARIFEPDTNAIDYVVGQVLCPPRHISAILPLARLPFDTIWIEDNTAARVQAMARQGTVPALPDEDEIMRLGFLIRRENETRWRCTPFPSELLQSKAALVLGFDYVVDTEHHVAPYLGDEAIGKLLNVSPTDANEKLIAQALGYQNKDALREVELQKLLPHVNVDLRALMALTGEDREKVARVTVHALQETAGNLRYVIGLLAAINLVETTFVAPASTMSRLMVGRRSIPYIASTKVSIKVPSKPLHRLARTHVTGWHNRAHEVRGHWRKSLDRDSGETVLRWVKEHNRGDASLGYVKHQYSVEGSTTKH